MDIPSSSRHEKDISLYNLAQLLIDRSPQETTENVEKLFLLINQIFSNLNENEKAFLYGRRPSNFDPIKDFLFLIDLSGKILFINQSLQEEMDDKNLVGNNIYYSKNDTNMPKVLITNAMDSNVFTSWEALFRKHDYSNTVVPIINNEGVAEHAFIISSNVSDNRDIEKELKDKDEFLSTALRINNSHIWTTDIINGTLTRHNYREHIDGMEHLEFVEPLDQSMKHFHPDDLPDIYKVIDDHVKGLTDRFYHESRVKHSDGEYYWYAFTGKIIDHINNIPLRTLGLATNINERKLAEKERKDMENQLYQSQKMEAIGRLAGSISHDFNNLLTAIIGQAELSLLNATKDQQIFSDLTNILDAAQRASVLSRQLLTISKKQKRNPKVLNLNESILNLLQLLKRITGEDITLELILDENIKEIKFDPSQLDQVLVNLIINARDAIENNGKIFIATKNTTYSKSNLAGDLLTTEGEYVVISISDTGCGIPKKIINEIFEPFFTTKAEGKGTGLGLSTVYGIVRQNNGAIHLYSEEDKGTTFRIYIPAVHSDKEAVESNEIIQIPPSGDEIILVVEDDDAVRTLTVATLLKYGYNVFDATSAAEAEDLLSSMKSSPDLIITDIFMPVTNGLDFIHHVSKDNPDTKVMYMSGYTSDFIRDKHKNLGNVPFLGKPFRPIELLTTVRKILDQ